MTLENENNQKIYESLCVLKTNISKTRINRIHAANRLLSTEKFLQGINIYYSCFSAVLAILGLYVKDTFFSVWSVIFTVVLAISIVHLNAQKYGNRSQELKTNYIALHELLFKVEFAVGRCDIRKYDEFAEAYCKLLQTSENHITMDYLKAKYKNGDLVKMDFAYYWAIKVTNFVVKTILILLPIVVMSIFFYKGIFVGVLW